jgi:hypothetical protein
MFRGFSDRQLKPNPVGFWRIGGCIRDSVCSESPLLLTTEIYLEHFKNFYTETRLRGKNLNK